MDTQSSQNLELERPGLKQAIRRPEKSGETNHRIMLLDGFKCVYCGYDGGASYEAWRRQSLSVDHFKPKHGGGSDDDDNLVTACSDCNAYKRQHDFPTIPEAARWLRLYRHELAKPWYEKHVVGKQSPSAWNNGEGREQEKRLWKRFKEGDDEQDGTRSTSPGRLPEHYR